MSDARTAVGAIVERDGLRKLSDDDVERLVALYTEIQADLAELRSPEVSAAEPAVIFHAE